MSLIMEAWRRQGYAPAGDEQLLQDYEDKLELERNKQDLIYALKYSPAPPPPPPEQYPRYANPDELGSGTFGMDDYGSLAARPDEQRAMASNGSGAWADVNDPGARRLPPGSAGQTGERADALPQKAQAAPARSAAWAPAQAGGGRGFVNPSPNSAHGNPPFAERSKVTDASADSQPMGYGEQMRHVGKFFGDVAIGAAKGLVNAVPETAALAYRGVGHAAAGVVSLIDSAKSDQMFAQYDKVKGRVLDYDNGLQEASGLASGLIGPTNALRGAAVAGDLARARLAGAIRTDYELGFDKLATHGVNVADKQAILKLPVAQALRDELLASGRPLKLAEDKTIEIINAGLALPTMRNAKTGEFFYKLQPLDADGNPLKSVYWMNSGQYARVKGMNAAEIGNVLGLPAPSTAHGAYHGFQVFETTPRLGTNPLVFESQIAPLKQGANYSAKGLDYQPLVVNPEAWYTARPIHTIPGVR